MVKFLLAAALLGSAGGAGGGTLIAVTHKPHKALTQVEIALGKPGKKNVLSVPGVALAPGDRLQRPFELGNKSGIAISALTLTTTASASSPLVDDSVNGLQLKIDRCSKPWQYDKKAQVYICKKIVTSVVAPRP